MISLNKEAAIIAHDIDKPFDFALKRRLIATIIDGRAFLLRRSIVRNKVIPQECIQSFAIPVEKAEPFSLYYNSNYKLSVRSKEPIPTVLRINQDTPFYSVSTLDGSTNFSNSDISTISSNSKAGKFVSGTGRYIYMGEHIAAYHNDPTILSSPFLLLRGILENPLLAKDYMNHFSYNEDNFPMPMDMAMDIRRLIMTGDLKIVPESQTIPINDK